MILGILFVIAGLIAFVWAGVKMDDYPGVDRRHLTPMLLGLAAIVIGAIILYGKAFGGW